MQTTTKKFTVQLIIPSDDSNAKWPYVGRAFVNKNGSVNLYLDDGVTIGGGQKLYLRPDHRPAAKKIVDRAPTLQGDTNA